MPQNKKPAPKKVTSNKKAMLKESRQKIDRKDDSLTDKELGYVTGGVASPRTHPQGS